MSESRGFSLIEVLISIFIMSIMLMLFQTLVKSSALVKASGNQGVALSIARNEIENIRAAGYENIPSSGSFTDQALTKLPLAATTLEISDYDAQTKKVVVSVSWQNIGFISSSTVSLSTLITNAGGLP